jgi:hypothetical protein
MGEKLDLTASVDITFVESERSRKAKEKRNIIGAILYENNSRGYISMEAAKREIGGKYKHRNTSLITIVEKGDKIFEGSFKELVELILRERD